MSESELATVLGQISFVGVVALDELLTVGAERGNGATVGDTIAGSGHDPVEAFESEEMRQVLADAINRMPDRERLVLTLYYYEGMTLAEIGNVLGVTESRVCQIHTKAIFQLRSRLSEPMPERGSGDLTLTFSDRQVEERLQERARGTSGEILRSIAS